MTHTRTSWKRVNKSLWKIDHIIIINNIVHSADFVLNKASIQREQRTTFLVNYIRQAIRKLEIIDLIELRGEASMCIVS